MVGAGEIDALTGMRSGWTAERTGVRERRWARGETQSQMGAEAAGQALADAGVFLEEVDVLIGACGAAEQSIPCTASRILSELAPRSRHVAAYDVNATCLSFLVAFDQAAMLVETGRANCVLIVSSEIASCGLNFQEAESAALMGDGAAAVLIKRVEGGSHVLSYEMRTLVEGVELAEIRGGGTRCHPRRVMYQESDYLFSMDGKGLFRLVVAPLVEMVETMLDREGLKMEEIKAVVAHQASGPAVELLSKRMGIPDGRLIRLYQKYGNTIAASLPMGLHELYQRGDLKQGDKVLFIGTSAGVSVATLLLEW